MAAKPCYQWQFFRRKRQGKAFTKEGKFKRFPFTTNQIASIWNEAKKEYSSKGIPFHDVYAPNGRLIEEGAISQMANKHGLEKEWIAQAFTEPKAIKKMTEKMFYQQAAARIYKAHANAMIDDLERSPWKRAVDNFYNAPRTLLIMGHSGVFPWTHMGQSLMVPDEWGQWFKTAGRSWSFFRPTEAGVAAWERSMTNMQFLPGYNMARRVTSSIDPAYTPPGIFGKYFGGSRRGIDSLKLARAELFSKEWVKHGFDQLPEKEQLEAAKTLMRPIEHATGVYMGKPWVEKGWMQRVLFAPQLLPARWAASLTDPYRAIRTYSRWQKATAGERAAAHFVARRTAASIGTMASILALNEALLQMTGSDDHVNLDDPRRSDWLRLKIGGYTIPLSFAFEPLRLAGQMIYSGAHPYRGQTTEAAVWEPVKQYGMQKLHPMAGTVVGTLYGRDPFSDRPLPWAGTEAGKYVSPLYAEREKEKEPLSIPEYVAGKGPIPLGEGAKEFYELLQDEGMTPDQAMMWVKTIGIAALGSAGPRVFTTRTKPEKGSGQF